MRYSKAAVFIEAGKPLECQLFELPEKLPAGAVICRVRMSTICGSDLHTIYGRRQEPAPLILGHEILGEVVAMGDPLPNNPSVEPLVVGDRVTWSVMASCGSCFYCMKKLPQKCENLRKYGHTCCLEPPHLLGGYAEYIYLFPGTAIYRVSDSIPDEVAVPANCSLSTAINAMEMIRFQSGETVLIQGAGMIGLNLIALCKEAGAAKIIVTDIDANRLAYAARFGADACFNVADCELEESGAAIQNLTGGHGVDVAFEVCGNQKVIAQAIEALRIGGRYLIAGLVMPGNNLDFDANILTRKCLTVTGIHNYRPDHLLRGLCFLEQHARKYPFADLVSASFSLDEINQAIETAATGEHVRVAVRCL
ncbi:MAG: zinc-binding dehydrogenase [Planctomycetia bacterium]|jgi:alcohol dehydrogenase